MNYSKIEVDKARPRKGLFQSIRTKLIVYFCLLFTVVMALIILAGLRGLPFTQFAGTKGQQKVEAFRSLNLVADLKKGRLLRWMKERHDDAKVASSNDMMRDNVALLRAAIREFTAGGRKDARLWALVREEKSYGYLLSYIEVVKTAYWVYHNIHIADAETGKIIVSSNDAYLGIDVSKELSFAGGLSSHDAYTTDIAFDPRDNFADFHISHSIADKEGEVIAIWMLEVYPEDIIRPMLHGGEGLGERGEALLVNGDVRILTSLKHPLPDGTRAKPLEYKIKAKPAVLAAHGKEGIIEAEDYRGEPVLAAYRHIRVASELGWGLVVKRDETELFAPLRKHIAYSVFIGLTSIFIVVVLIIFLARDLTRPIISLSRTADRIADGDLDARVLVTTSDEAGHLAVTFNSMIQQIQNWHKELEEQVNARTADLKKANRALKMLSECNKALVKAPEEAQLLHEICQIIVDVGQYRLAWIGYAEHDQKKTVRPVAQTGYEDSYLETVEITWADTERGRGTTGTAIRTGRPSICKDMLTDPKYTLWRSEATKRGYKSSISLPLISEDRTLGALNIYAADPDAFDENEVKLLNELADDLAYGIMALHNRAERMQKEEALRKSQQLLNKILASLDHAVLVVDPTTRTIVVCNPAVERIFGYREKEVIGRNTEFLHVDRTMYENFGKNLFPALDRDGVYNAEYKMKRKDGSVFYTENTVTEIVDDSRNRTGVVSVVSDVTERKQMQNTMRSERDKFQGVINAIGEGLYIVNQDYTIEYQNEVLSKSFGDIRGKKCFTSIFQSNKPCDFCIMHEVIKSGKTQSFETSLPDGRTYDIVFSPFTDVDDNVKAIVLMQDITEKKTLQAETMRAGHLASLGELAAGVAHEINNPITGIISFAEILKDQCNEQGEDDEIPTSIIEEGDRIATIIKNLLSFARDRKEEHSPVHVRDILANTLGLAERQIKKDGIKFSMDVPVDLPKIKARSQEIQQVFLNIISNARYALNQRYAGFNEKKLLEIKCETTEIEGRKHVRTTFYDGGLGIPESILDKISNPFFTTKPQGEGTGLGLSISHGIIKNHGGRLWFESVEGEFTKVMVDLPVDNEWELGV